MPEWIPTENSPKGRLVLRAMDAFSTEPFNDVNVVALCAAADVTTGTLYHHFQTKLGLYHAVRLEVERRTLDRIAGALAARADDPPVAAVRAALLVAFDYIVETGRVRLVAAPPPADRADPLEGPLASILGSRHPTARIWLAAWRAALMCTVDGYGVSAARATLARFTVDES